MFRTFRVGAGFVGAVLATVSVVTAAQHHALRPRSIDGVVAVFRVPKPRIKVGDELQIDLTLRNTTTRVIKFRYTMLVQRIFSRGREVQDQCVAGEMPAFDITLQPGASERLDTQVPVEHCFHLRPGVYSVHIYYPLDLLTDRALAAEYARRYRAEESLVPWSGQLLFRVTE